MRTNRERDLIRPCRPPSADPAAGFPDLLVADVEGCLPFYLQIGPVPAPAANRRDRTIFFKVKNEDSQPTYSGTAST